MKINSFLLLLITFEICSARTIRKENDTVSKFDESEILGKVFDSFSKNDFEKIYPSHFTEKDIKEDLLKNIQELGLGFLDQSSGFECCSNADAYLTTPQLIKKYGYPVEIHTVQTADGYLLELHRIPRPGGTPVLLQHGILDTSAAWVINGPQSALAYLLSDLGYDVWMGNSRGNRYSKKHLFLNPRSSKFWDFSFHELGVYDVPATIDYITREIGLQKMHYIAHSQGSTIFFVMCHLRPGYCDRIISMNALSPVAFLQNVRSPLIRLLSKFINSLEFIIKILGIKEVLPNNVLLSMAGQLVCKEKAITQTLCSNLLFLIVGYDSQELNKTMLPVIMGHVPAGASAKQLIHFGQLIRSEQFQMYDYGLVKNWFTYGSLHPPKYDLSKVTAPVALHYSMNDWIAHPVDVNRLEKLLPNVVQRRVPLKAFNHMDFVYAIDVKKLLYESVIQTLRRKDLEEEQKINKL